MKIVLIVIGSMVKVISSTIDVYGFSGHPPVCSGHFCGLGWLVT